jgi:ribonuclease Z
MKVTLLGTGSPIPDGDRAGPATLVQAGPTSLMVDCGRGVLMRLTAAGVLLPMVDSVLITHLHSDHVTDLNDVITMHWVMSPGPTTLPIFGPPGLDEVVEATIASLELDIGYRIAHHDDLDHRPDVDVTIVEPGQTFQRGDVSVTVGATDHRPVEPSVGYRFESEGSSAVVAGDSVPCDSLTGLCAGADAYVQTVIRDDLVRLVPVPRLQDILDYHSSVSQAAQTAAAAGVGTLILTHYVPALADGQEDEWRAIAAEHFDGEVVLGPDLTSVEV